MDLKVAVYGTRKYDVDAFANANTKTSGIELTFLEANLDIHTVALAAEQKAICIFVNDICNAEILQKLKDMGVGHVALRCAGFDNVDIATAQKLGIKISRVPSYSPESVAEFAVGMILTMVRKYHKAYNRVREGNFLLDGLLGFNLSGKTVGIVGTGKIGMLTGKILAQGFNCKVIAYDPYPNLEVAKKYGIKYVGSLEALMRQSDIVSLHCPLLESTKYMINDQTLCWTKKGFFLVNTSRGGLIDSQALICGLKSGHLGAVGLDVYEKESSYFFADSSEKIIQDDNFARLLTFYNVFISGHQAFLTNEALTNISETTVENLINVAEGNECPNLVNTTTKLL